MGKLTLPIPSLTGGVSTQPEPLRLPQQAEVSTNAIASVVEGLRRRPPTEYIGDLIGYDYGAAGVSHHPIHNDDGDYVVVAGDGTLEVFDLANPGTPVVLRNTSGGVLTGSDLGYLSSSDPQADFRFITLSEFTLVMNRAKTVQAQSDTTAFTPNQALISVLSGNYRSTYEVILSHSGGDQVHVRYETYASNGTPPSGTSPQSIPTAEQSIRTNHIATQLTLLLTTGQTGGIAGGTVINGNPLSSANWAVHLSGSHFVVRRKDGTDFTITIRESQGSTSMRLAYKKVQLFSDLPKHAPVGMKIEVNGDPSSPDSGYWAEFASHEEAPGGQFADGYWRESVKAEISKGLDALTMPHALIRQANGEFQWTPLDGENYVVASTEYEVPTWAERTVGDLESNPDPDFVGKKLRDMCFHEGRLGLLSESALTLSETREPFSFYRTTVVDVLDTERIELDSGNVQEEQLSHAVPVGADIVLFADGTQFVVRADGAFTPNSVSLITGSHYDSNPDAQPIPVRESLFVATERSGRGSLHEFRVEGERRPKIGRVDLTASAADYVGRVRTLTTSAQLETAACTSLDDDYLYVYTHFFNDGERIAQAWQKFTFAGDPSLRHAWFDGTTLYLILENTGESARLFKMRLAPFEKDGVDTLVHLDQRVDQNQCGRVLDGANTNLTLPFLATADMLVVEKSTGKQIRVLGSLLNILQVAGDHMTSEFWVGRPIAFRHDLSKVRRFDENQRPVIGADLHLDRGSVYYEDSGPFDVVIMPDDTDQPEYIERFTGPYLGVGANYQSMRPTSGTLKFSICKRSKDCRISIRSSDPWPLRVVSMDIQAREVRTHGLRR